MIQALLSDLRFAVRTLRKSPGFTALSLITLGLGVGATVAMFSVINSTLLRPLPFKDPGRLVLIKELIPRFSSEPGWIPAPDVIAFQNQTKSFEGVGGYVDSQMDLVQDSNPVRISVGRMNWTTFAVLGVAPILGRTFTENEDRPDSHIAILSYDCWQQRFAGKSGIVGQTIELERKSYNIIGVMPRGFTIPLETAYPTPVELWVPMGFTNQEKAAYASLFIYGAVARLKPRVTDAQALADVQSLMPGIMNNYPSSIKDQGVTCQAAIVPFAEDTYRSLRAPVYALFVAVIFVLLIAIANVGALMLARGSTRQKEFAIRISLGATGRRLLTQLLTESALLSLFGGALGVLFAEASARLLMSRLPLGLQRVELVTLDIHVVVFTVFVSAGSGVLCGAAPGFFALRTNLARNLKEGGGRSGGSGRQHQRVRAALVIAQVALALILLTGSGLLLRSFEHLIAVKTGFRPERVTVGSVFLPVSEYQSADQVRRFFNELVSRMRQIPAVQAASISTAAPLRSGWVRLVNPEGYEPPPGGGINQSSDTAVEGDYFGTMGIPLLRGRFFSPEESVNGSNPVIISQSFARRYFAGKDPIGLRLKFIAQQQPTSWLTVVGLVGDVKPFNLEDEILPEAYVPFTSEEIPILQRLGGVSACLCVRTGAESGGIAAALQSVVRTLDRQLPVTDVMTMNQVVDQSTAPRRFTMILVISFASAALLLAATGLYGVIANSVTQRTHEVGIRMALGAAGTDIRRMVLGWGLTLTAVGVAVGLAGAWALTRLLSSVLSGLLFGVRPFDPITFAGVTGLLTVVALVACFVPAARASNVDPMSALRCE